MGTKKVQSPVDPLLKFVKSTAQIHYLANVLMPAKQMSSMALAVPYVPMEHLLSGIVNSITPSGAKFAVEHSNLLLSRAGGDPTIFEVNEDLSKLSREGLLKEVGKIKDKTSRWALEASVGAMDARVATAVWLGAYDYGLKKFNGVPAAAKRFADDIVLKTQGSGDFLSSAPAFNHSELVNSMLSFKGFANTLWNVMRDDMSAIKGGKKPIFNRQTPFLISMLGAMAAWDASVDWLKRPESMNDESYGSIS